MNLVLSRVMAITKDLRALLPCLKWHCCEFCWNLRTPLEVYFMCHYYLMPMFGVGEGTRMFSEAVRNLVMENWDLGEGAAG